MKYPSVCLESSTESCTAALPAELPPAYAPARPRPTVLPVHAPPLAIPVPGVERDIQVKIASDYTEWEEAFSLVANNYRTRGYEAAETGSLRFTPYHALPDTTTFVAKHEGTVVATLSLVPDNVFLGLPMECIYGEEITRLRQEGRNLVEVTSLADRDLTLREFIPVFVSLIRLMTQWVVQEGGDTWVITVNPRHRAFYRKVFGFVPLGPWRAHPSVQNHPAEAYLVTEQLVRAHAADMGRQLFDELLPAEALQARRMPPSLVRYFGHCSSTTDIQTVEEILRMVGLPWNPCRWRQEPRQACETLGAVG